MSEILSKAYLLGPLVVLTLNVAALGGSVPCCPNLKCVNVTGLFPARASVLAVSINVVLSVITFMITGNIASPFNNRQARNG